jgi:ATP-binding cassette subfamily B protein
MEKNTKTTFKILWGHAKKYKIAITILFLSIFVTSLARTIAPLFFKEFFDVLTGEGDLSLRTESLKDILFFKILLIYVIEWIGHRFSSQTLVNFESKTIADLQNSCFANLHKHSVNFFNNNFVGALVKKANRFSRAFEGITDIIVFEFFPILIRIVFIVVVLSLRNIYLGLAVLAWVIIYCTVNYLFSLYKLKYDTQKAKTDSKVTGILADTVTNHLNIKLFASYDREEENFKKNTSALKKIRWFCWTLSISFEAIQALLMIALEVGVLYGAVNLWKKGIITIGDFALIQGYLLIIFYQLWSFGRVIRRYYENLADAKEMTEIFEAPVEIKNSLSAKDLIIKKGGIEFKDVDFSYHKTRKVISNLNLKIKPNEKVAFVGASGSGKSTLVNLLLRNYEIDKGSILIDGQKISSVTLDSLRRNVSLVPQDSVLFHRTLKENIAYGKPEATEEEIAKASNLAHCDNFISNLSEGYETYVGERGIKLSGGERQRVSIARSILKNAPILILDEATSSLDSESEQLIQSALDNLMKDKTVVVIAHRLSTIMKMDRIILLDEGKVIEEGTHQELLEKKGRYSQLWNKQVGGFID